MPSRHEARVREAWAAAAAIAAVTVFALGALPALAQSQTDLERAYQTIASKTFVDLTHSFGPDTPVWSGFRPGEILPCRRSEDA